MKNNFRNIILTILLITILYNCTSYKRTFYEGNGDIEQARMNVISDFAHTYKTPNSYIKERKGKPFTIFRMFDNEITEKFYVFGISPYNNNYISISIKDSLGKVPVSHFPNRYIIKENKLFLWRDNITPLSKEILNVIQEYGVLDSTDVKKVLGLLPDDFEDERLITIDDKLKGVNYYVCKSNINKYKKVKTNIAFGYYKPPKLKCE